MKKKKTSIKDLFIIENNRIFKITEGFFLNLGISINSTPYLSLIHLNKITFQFQKNVLRGLHLQLKPFSQLKLVQVLQGKF